MNNIDVCWGVCLIGGITICDDVVVGANSTITKSIKESGIYVSINKKIDS